MSLSHIDVMLSFPSLMYTMIHIYGTRIGWHFLDLKLPTVLTASSTMPRSKTPNRNGKTWQLPWTFPLRKRFANKSRSLDLFWNVFDDPATKKRSYVRKFWFRIVKSLAIWHIDRYCWSNALKIAQKTRPMLDNLFLGMFSPSPFL